MFSIVDGGTMTIGTNADDRHRHSVHVASVRRDAAAVHGGDQSRSSSRRYDGHMENQSVGVPAVGSSSSNSGEPIYAFGAVDQYTRRPGGQEGRLYRVFRRRHRTDRSLGPLATTPGRYGDRTANGAWSPNGPTSFLKQAPAGCAPGRTPFRVSHKPPQRAPASDS
jgi:hypothetical protein